MKTAKADTITHCVFCSVNVFPIISGRNHAALQKKAIHGKDAAYNPASGGIGFPPLSASMRQGQIRYFGIPSAKRPFLEDNATPYGNFTLR
jgi:hypothetical protein